MDFLGDLFEGFGNRHHNNHGHHHEQKHEYDHDDHEHKHDHHLPDHKDRPYNKHSHDHGSKHVHASCASCKATIHIEEGYKFCPFCGGKL